MRNLKTADELFETRDLHLVKNPVNINGAPEEKWSYKKGDKLHVIRTYWSGGKLMICGHLNKKDGPLVAVPDEFTDAKFDNETNVLQQRKAA